MKSENQGSRCTCVFYLLKVRSEASTKYLRPLTKVLGSCDHACEHTGWSNLGCCRDEGCALSDQAPCQCTRPTCLCFFPSFWKIKVPAHAGHPGTSWGCLYNQYTCASGAMDSYRSTLQVAVHPNVQFCYFGRCHKLVSISFGIEKLAAGLVNHP